MPRSFGLRQLFIAVLLICAVAGTAIAAVPGRGDRQDRLAQLLESEGAVAQLMRGPGHVPGRELVVGADWLSVRGLAGQGETVEFWAHPRHGARARDRRITLGWGASSLRFRTALEREKWSHVAVSWSEAEIRLDLDGQTVESYGLGEPSGVAKPHKLSVGRRALTSAPRWVALYNNSIGVRSVVRHYRAGLSVLKPPAAPVAKRRGPVVAHAAAVPANTVLPAITGTAKDGQTLTSTTGTWSGSPTSYARQWLRCDTAGANCTNISGATATTYVLTATDVGKTIRIKVTATNGSGSANVNSAQTATVVAAAPVVSVVPTISGTAKDGQTLTSTTGTWSGTATITYARQWNRCNSGGTGCVAISGATGTTYVATPADIGSKLNVTVTASNAAGSASSSSVVTALVTGAAPVNTALPAITGTAKEGQLLSATTGTWTGTATITYAYQWQQCSPSCTNISGATASTYRLVAAQVGKTIKVVLTATNGTGSASATSAATATVTTGAPVNTALPVVTGTTTQGQVLSSTTGTWVGTATITYARQWKRCNSVGGSCTNISGATGTTYTLVAADVGNTIKLTVTATNGVGNVAAEAATTAVVAPLPPSNTAVPAISGTAQDGQALTSTTGTWNGTTPLSYSRQWRRCDSAGANCSDISGATAATYTTTSADVASKIRVVVTATNGAGSASATSAATASVTAVAPVNTAAPTITGTAKEGELLTANPGTWSGTTPITYTYQWQRCSPTCAVISGATAATRRLDASDVATTLKVAVTATNSAGTPSATSAASATVTTGPPANLTLPAITGTAQIGQTLSTTTGTWAGTATITTAVQWKRCDSVGANCTIIPGATNTSYTLTVSDVGSKLSATVGAANDAGSASADAAVTAVVLGIAPTNLTAPTISGTAKQARTLSASTGAWSGTAPITHARQWRRCDSAGATCVDIAGATAASYSPTAADVNGKLRVVVTATNTTGNASATSSATATVQGSAIAQAPTLALTGTLVDHQNDVLDQGSYDLDAAATAGADSDGIDLIRVTLDDQEQPASTTTCHATACTAHAVLSLEAAELADGTHEFAVEAFSEEGDSDTEEFTFTIDHGAPAPPRGLVFEPQLGSTALSWSDLRSSDHDGWMVYRQDEGEPTPTALTTQPVEEPVFVDIAPPTGATTYTVREVDTVGNLSSASSLVTVTGDETSLAGPGGLDASASSVGVALSWEPLFDARDYRVYRRESAGDWTLVETEVAGLSYEDSDVVEDDTYDYAIRAVMPNSQLSMMSATATATATDSPETAPTSVDVQLDDDAQLADAETWVYVVLTGIAGDELNAYIDGDPVPSLPLICVPECDEYQYVVIDKAALGLGDHTLAVELERDSEVVSSDEVNFTLLGDPAEPPVGVTASVSSAGEVTLAWQPSSSDAVTQYQVARTGATTATVTDLQYEDPIPLGTNESRTYSLSGVSSCCVSQTPATITVHDTDQLPAPTGLQAQQTGQSAVLSWTASAGATSYDVFRASTSGGPWVQITPSGTSTTSYTDYGVQPGNDYYYAVRAQDGSVVSALSASSMVHIDAPTGPSPTVTLSGPLVDAQGQPLSDGEKTLSIHATGGAVISLAINDGDDPLLDKHQSCPTTCDFDFVWTFAPADYEDGTHDLTITATDAQGRQATQQLQVTVNASAPAQVQHLAATQNATAVLLQWEATVAQDLADYQLMRAEGDAEFTVLQTINATTHQATDSNVEAGHTYRYQVVARDQAGNTSEPSDTLSVPFGGAATTPPTGLSASTNPYSVSLTWQAITEPDLAGYRVYRRWQATGPYLPVTEGTITQASFIDDEVSPEDTPQYHVRVVNRRGYESDPSGAVSVQVPHTVATPLARRVLVGDALGEDTPNPTWTPAPGCNGGLPYWFDPPCKGIGRGSLASDGQTMLLSESFGRVVYSVNLAAATYDIPCRGQDWSFDNWGWHDLLVPPWAAPFTPPTCGPSRAGDWDLALPGSPYGYWSDLWAMVSGPQGKFAVQIDGSNRGEIVENPGQRVIDTDTGNSTDLPDHFRPRAYTADGTLYYEKSHLNNPLGECELWRRSPAGAPERVYLPRIGDEACGVAITPDGTGYVTTAGTGVSFRSFDGSVDRPLHTVTGPNVTAYPLWDNGSVSGDGERVAYRTYNSVTEESQLYSTGVDGGHSRPYAGLPNPHPSDQPTYAAADSSLAIDIDEATVGDGQEPISIAGTVTATNTTVQDVKLVIGATSQNVTLSSGHFNVALTRSGLPEGRIKARVVATSANGIERSATTDVVVDRSAPLATKGFKVESKTLGTAHVSWDELRDSTLPDGTEGSGISKVTYRYRRADQAWSGWQDGALTGFDAPSSQLGTAIQTRVDDAAGNTKLSRGILKPSTPFATCNPYTEKATIRRQDASISQMRGFRSTRAVIDGEFRLVCQGEFDRAEVKMNWVYNTGGDNWKNDNKTPPMQATIHFDDVDGHDIPGLPVERQYPFKRTSPCPSGAADESDAGPTQGGIPYHNWAIKATIKLVRDNAKDRTIKITSDTSRPSHFECPNEGQRRAWRVAAFKQIANYSPVRDNDRFYGDPSRVLGIQLDHDGDDEDEIPLEIPFGWEAHHLVPVRDFSSPNPGDDPTYADRLRDALFSCRIHPNSPVNGMWLRGRTLRRFHKGTDRYNENWLTLQALDKADGTTYAASTHHYDTRVASYLTKIEDKAIRPNAIPREGWCSARHRNFVVTRLRTTRDIMRLGKLGTEQKKN